MESSAEKLVGITIDIWAFIIACIALLVTMMKDFILPMLIKPKLEFTYREERPFRRSNVAINRDSDMLGAFFRFSVKNIGRSPAINCRCQIEAVKKQDAIFGDYQGYPLRWASRPESSIDSVNGERLNIGRGEIEFVDLAVATNHKPWIHLQKYHSVDIGMSDIIEPGVYDVHLLFSGDNFSPYRLEFHIEKENNCNSDDVSITLNQVKQY